MTDQNILIPEVSDGAEIFPGRFFIISPEETTNLIKNPSVETDITGYLAINSTIARSVTLGHQRRGFYGIDINPQINAISGVYYLTDTILTPGVSYTFSCDVFGIHNCEYRIYFANAAGTSVISPLTAWRGRNEWKRVSVTYTETDPLTRMFQLIRMPSPETDTFFTDGWQLEAKAYPTTYTDGDQLGLTPGELAYGWNGPIHASTSYRSGDTRSGGREMPIDGNGDGIKIMAVVGLGEPPVENFATELNTGGAMYLNTVYKPRNFSLAGSMQSLSGMSQLLTQRAELRSLISILNTTRRQPMKLRYRTYDEVDCELGGRAYDIVCCYVGGLEGNITNPDQERITMNFIEYDPGIAEDGETATELESFELVNNSAYFSMLNKRTGRVEALTTAPDLYVNAIKEYTNGVLVIGGAFTSFNGVAVGYICLYNLGTKTVTALGTGLNGPCQCIDVDSAGNIIAGGGFTTAGGTTVNGIAKWNGTTWSAYNIGPSVGVHGGTAEVFTVRVAPDNTFYIGGSFTDFCGVANTTYVARWTGTTSNALGTGANNVVFGLKFNKPNTLLFVCGSFTSMSGTATTGMSIWNYTTLAWSVLNASAGLPAVSGYLELNSDNGVMYCGISGTGTYAYTGSSWNRVSLISGALAYDQYDKVLYIGKYTYSGGSTSYMTKYEYFSVYVSCNKEFVFYSINSLWNVAGPKVTEIPITGKEFINPIFRIERSCKPLLINNLWKNGVVRSETFIGNYEQITMNMSDYGLNVSSDLTGNWVGNIKSAFNINSFKLNAQNKKIRVALDNTQTTFNDAGNQYYLATAPFMITGLTILNTDNHTIYISSISDGAGFYHTEIFKAAARGAGNLIAHTASYTTVPLFHALIADNASGVGGFIYITAKTADVDIYMIYGFVSMRWQNKYMGIDDVI